MLTPNLLLLGVGWYAVFVFSTCLHEAGHAWAAWRLGDPTAYHGGQVTLNPLPHIQREPLGMVVIPVLAFVFSGGGWMVGWASAPYDPRWAASYPRRGALMALAGPVANLLLVVVSGVALRAGLQWGWFAVPREISFEQVVGAPAGGIAAGLATILSIFFMLNLILLIFNLLPLPPLDGSGALPLVLPRRIAGRYLEFIRQPGFGLIGIIVAWNLFPKVFLPVARVLLGLLHMGL